MIQPRQAITSLLLAGVLPAFFVSHRLHRRSAGMIPVDLKSPCTSLGLPLGNIIALWEFVPEDAGMCLSEESNIATDCLPCMRARIFAMKLFV